MVQSKDDSAPGEAFARHVSGVYRKGVDLRTKSSGGERVS